MLKLNFGHDLSRPFRLLCLGAHADDLEIGCGATVLRLIDEMPVIAVRWIVFSGAGPRADEARASAEEILGAVPDRRIEIMGFRDSYFPHVGAAIKDAFEALRQDFDPTLVLTHWRHDAHQDHRVIAELTQNTFRNHLILQYEIPKYDPDLGNPNFLVPMSRSIMDRKLDLIRRHFPSQDNRAWFSDETFMSLARLRGIACNASEGLAEGFYAEKLKY